MVEKIIQPKSTSADYPNLIYTPDLVEATVNDLTYLYDDTEVYTPSASGCQAVGRIALTDLPLLGEHFTIDTQTFTFVILRSGTGEVTRGNNINECIENIFDAVNADLLYFNTWSWAMAPTQYGWLRYKIPGTAGNSIVFSESCTNMSMDGSGYLGGTTVGADNFELLEELTVIGKGYPTILTASDEFLFNYFYNGIIYGAELGLEYRFELYDNTASESVKVIRSFAFDPFIGTCFPSITIIENLIDGHSYTWSMSWQRFIDPGLGIFLIAVSRLRFLSIREVKR